MSKNYIEYDASLLCLATEKLFQATYLQSLNFTELLIFSTIFSVRLNSASLKI